MAKGIIYPLASRTAVLSAYRLGRVFADIVGPKQFTRDG